MRQSKIYQISEKEFAKLVKTCHSRSEILFCLNVIKSGGTCATLNKRIKELNLDGSHLGRDRANKAREVNTYPLEKILIANSTYCTSDLKKRLIKTGLLENKCVLCGNGGEWMGQPLTLQLDHINGIRNDHRKNNLRILCPNCHTQTKTWGKKTRDCCKSSLLS